MAKCEDLGVAAARISADFAKVCTCHPLASLGHHRLRGVGEPQEIFTPTLRAP